ncbi:hypothetical protein FRC02_009724 [Tulasnella sp. 418]|nr:hypothetical protein FRC02_009724 [Tulasnella sp. 418]
MQECGVEGLIWQMATNDPLACNSTTRRDQRWYLRWAISKFNLAPEVDKPAERAPEIEEEGGRRVVGLRKGRLASVALEETSNVKRHASSHNSGDA